MSTPPDRPEEGPDLRPPGEGYRLYRYRNAANMSTENWSGLYWARRIGEKEYEIRTVPTSLGEPSAFGGRMPASRFEELYEQVDL